MATGAHFTDDPSFASDFDRHTLCIAQPKPGLVSHVGDPTYQSSIQSLYSPAESRALEQLTLLKSKLRRTGPDDFWFALCKGLAEVGGSEYSFVSQRIPLQCADGTQGWGKIGDSGSCLMALSWYFDDGKELRGFAKDVQYAAYSCPCAYMKYDKTFIIPERYDDFIKDNPNAANILIPPEAYIGVPLFTSDGECFAHFGLMWSKDAIQKRKIGWGFTEMLCHALEDIILDRILERPIVKNISTNDYDNVMIQRVAAASTSLRPHARSLSHELRTPMQGIMGMLDVMYATVQEEAASNSTNPSVLKMLENIKENINMAQDSSRRASEAADNVVRAYDLNMGTIEEETPAEVPMDFGDDITFVDGRRSASVSRSSSPRGTKRRRSNQAHEDEGPLKLRPSDRVNAGRMENTSSPRSFDTPHLQETPTSVPQVHSGTEEFTSGDYYNRSLGGVQHTNIRDLCKAAVKESLRVGSRPESVSYRNTRVGQVIEVVTKWPDGTVKNQFVTWATRDAVPGHILVNERDLTKALSCVLQNALKFADDGKISLDVSLYVGVTSYIDFTITDTGPGISKSFQRELFKPFSREDTSTTRHKDGLGLGLLVAKGIAVKLGGTLKLVRSDTEGPAHGSEFKLRVPLSPPANLSRGTTPTPVSVHSQPETPKRVQRQNTSIGSSSSDPFLEVSNPTSASFTPMTTAGPEQLDESVWKWSGSENTSTLDASMAASHLQTNPHLHETSLSTSLPTPPVDSDSGSRVAPSDPRPKTHQRRSSKLDRDVSFNRDFAASHPLTFLVVEDNVINRRILVSMLIKLGYDPATQIYEAFDGVDAVRQYVESMGQLHDVPGEDPGLDTSQSKKSPRGAIDIVLMDLWMPHMSGYEAAEKILEYYSRQAPLNRPGARRSISEPQRLPSISDISVEPLPSDESQAADHSSSSTARRQSEVSNPPAVLLPESSVDSTSPHLVPHMVPPTILAVTADATDGAAEKAAQVGMQGFMVKPFKLKDLERLVREGWGRRMGVDASTPNWIESPV